MMNKMDKSGKTDEETKSGGTNKQFIFKNILFIKTFKNI